MLKLYIEPRIAARLLRELKRAGRREIGGVLVGESLGSDTFRLMNFSTQRSGGGYACFLRDPELHRPFLARFFDETGHNYERFNYLGEWHSHPSFSVEPSRTDIKTMLSLVNDPAQAAAFSLLMICRHDLPSTIRMSSYAFKRNSPPEPVQLFWSGSFPKRNVTVSHGNESILISGSKNEFR